MIKLHLTSEELIALYKYLDTSEELNSVFKKVERIISLAVDAIDDEGVDVVSGIMPNSPEFVPAYKRWESQQNKKINSLQDQVDTLLHPPKDFLTLDESDDQQFKVAYPKIQSPHRRRPRKRRR